MGVLPIIFDKCNFNKKINKTFLKKKSLFSQSLFLTSDKRDYDKTPEFKKKELYTKTIIVGGLEAKNSLENLEFLIGRQTLTETAVDLLGEAAVDKKM
jgi:hypothetical protein